MLFDNCMFIIEKAKKSGKKTFKSTRDKKIAYATLKLFEDRKNIEIFNILRTVYVRNK